MSSLRLVDFFEMRLKYNMVNPAYRLLLGMIVLLTGVELRSASAQYGPASGAPGSIAQASYGPGKHGPVYYEQAPVVYEGVDPYQSGYYGPPEQSEMITRVLPVDRGWAYDHPMDGLFDNLVNNSWMRVEYLLWKAPPGNQLLGGQLPSGNDPRMLFVRNDALGDPTLSGKEADLDTIGSQGTNGIRGTFGVDFVSGTIETSFFGTETDSSSVSYGPPDLMGSAFGQPDMITMLVTVDGQVTGQGRNFNQSFAVDYRTQAWGVESNYVINTERLFFRSYSGAGGLQIRPLVGFRYLKIGEGMDITGSFEELTTVPTIPFFTTTINTSTNNKLYVPQAGIRMEFVHPLFTISAEPKVGFGVNNYRGSVTTNQFLGATDPTHVTSISDARFSPTFEFGINARLHLTEWFTFNVGYNFLWANHIARPGTINYYNISSANTTDGVSIQAQNSLDSYKLHGLVLGGEIRFP